MTQPKNLHDKHSEQQIVGCSLMEPESMDTIAANISPGQFVDPLHRAAYEQLIAMDEEGVPMTPAVLASRLRSGSPHDNVAVYLAGVMKSHVTSAHAEYHARRIAKASHKRKLMQITESCNELLLGGATCGKALVKMQAACDTLSHEIDAMYHRDELRTATVVIDEFLSELNRGNGEPIETGIGDLDYALSGGLSLGEMAIIAGRPSQGKTMVALQILDSMSKSGYGCLLLSEEMSEQNLARRFMNRITPVGQDMWSAEEDELRRDFDGWKNDRQDLYITVASGTIDKAVRAIDASARRGVKVVAVDYAQLLQGNGKGIYERNTDVSVQLRQAATRNNVMLLCLCQLSRKNEEHAGEPKMSDLRDSGQYEQDADVIIFVDWPSRRGDHQASGDEYYLRIRKNRNRETKTQDVELTFDPRRQTLTSKNHEWQP